MVWPSCGVMDISHLQCSHFSCSLITHGHRCAVTIGYGHVAPLVLSLSESLKTYFLVTIETKNNIHRRFGMEGRTGSLSSSFNIEYSTTKHFLKITEADFKIIRNLS
jgi:hypothetical protein